MAMFLVTGGAGFIGSNVVASLNEAGATDVAVSDLIGQGDAKWRNLAKHQVADLVPPAELMAWLDGRKLDAVIHMGAISDTTATDGDLRRHMRNNLLDARVDDVMTPAPKTVRPDQLISETLDILNSLKVTALFAVEAGKPVGVIHVHDLLRAGAA